MKIIITGGAGFIGSHITDAYIRAGHKIVIVDNLATGFRKNVNPRAKFYKTDVRNFDKIEAIFKKERPETVNHHAALIDVTGSVANPLPTINTNAIGTANLLVLFGKYGRGRKKFIFPSSAAVYGDPRRLPVIENAPLSPLSAYGLSKMLAEESVRFLSKQLGLRYMIFRYANVYGPRQKTGAIVLFLGMMKNHRRPTIFGDGKKTRDYLHVNDVARANLLALKNGHNETVNLGWGKEITDAEMFAATATVSGFDKLTAGGFDKPPLYKPHREGEIRRMALNAQKAKKILGWRPKVQLEEGVKRTIAGI